MYDVNKMRLGETQLKRIETSAGFQETKHWERMDAVYHTLTADERRSVERRASGSGSSVSRIVANCGTETLKQDYAKLLEGACWSNMEVTPLHIDPASEGIA
jgi:hypothetical protein